MQPRLHKTSWGMNLLLGAGLLALLLLLAPAGAGAQNLIVDNGDTFYVPPSITELNEIIGRTGQGTLVHLFGSNTVNNNLDLGGMVGSSGTYYLYPFGSLSANREFIGYDGTGHFFQFGGKNMVTEEIRLGFDSTASGVYNLKGGRLQVDGNEYLGYSGNGTVHQSGGTNMVTNNLYLGYESTGSGTYNLKGGRLQVDGDEFIGFGGTGTVNQSGGKHTVGGDLFVGNGTYNLSGGKLSAKTINITGTFNVLNTSTTVTGDVENLGTVKTTKAAVTWDGNFNIVGRGVYISDHAKQTFTDLNVVDQGFVTAASQDVFKIKEDFMNQSTNASAWDTAAATLKFVRGAGWDTDHDFYIPGEDTGPPGDFPVTELPPNFAWGTLNILGQTVHLFDGNDSNDGTAQYVGGLVGAKVNWFTKMVYNIINDDSSEINIYYDPDLWVNFYLHGKTYNFAEGLGQLKPFHTPLPPSVLLLGSGLLGLSLLGWRRKRSG